MILLSTKLLVDNVTFSSTKDHLNFNVLDNVTLLTKSFVLNKITFSVQIISKRERNKSIRQTKKAPHRELLEHYHEQWPVTSFQNNHFVSLSSSLAIDMRFSKSDKNEKA